MPAVLAALVALAGTAACAGPASPSASAAGPEPSAMSDERLVGTWSSTVHGSPRTEISVPGGPLISIRARCSGSGELTVRVHGATFANGDRVTCNGRWHFIDSVFPPGGGSPDPGPYPGLVERPDTVTSWDVEAYASELPPTPPPRSA
jgi:hypothetical protein